MTEQTELNKIEVFVRTKLQENTALVSLVADRMHKGKAPVTTLFPCVIFQYYGPGPAGGDVEVGGGDRWYTDTMFIVKFVDIAATAMADSTDRGAALIDKALTGEATGDIFVCRRTQPFDNSYIINNVEYAERGGIYNLATIGG